MGCVRETRQERRARERGQKKGVVSPVKEVPHSSPKQNIAPLILSGLVGMIVALVGVKIFFPVPKKEAPKQKEKHVHVPSFSLRGKTYGNILELAPEEVPATDIAELNLLCGSGLSGTENIDID